MLADLGVHFLVAHIDLNAHAGFFQFRAHFVGVLGVALADGNDHGLDRRQPHRERARVVLDQDAEEALDRSIQRAVHHHRLVALPVLADVFQVEALRQVEVELNGRKLPQAADGVHQLDVNLGPVERGFAGDQLVLDAHALHAVVERAHGHVPVGVATLVMLAVLRVPGGKLDLVLVETEVAQHVERELHTAGNLVLDLVAGTENVRVVLGKAADAQQPVHDSGALVTIDGAQLAQPHRQIAIRAQRVHVNQDVPRAVHGLEAVVGVVELHRGKHVLLVEALVPGDLPQVHAHHVRRIDERIPATQVLVAHPVLHRLADDAALGMPENQPRPGQFLDGEQVELLAQYAVVALLRLLDLLQVLVEVFLAEERGAVDALELRVLLVAQPVGAGDAGQLERLDLAGGRNVRPAAEVHELAGLVERDFFVGLGELLDEVTLHEVTLALELLQPFRAGDELARVGLVALRDLLHLFFDSCQVLGGERLLAMEVVEETALGRRTVSELGLWEKFEHRGRHQVRRRVPVHLQRLGVAVGQDAHFGVLLDGPRQIDELAIDLRHHGGIGQARRDGPRNLQRRSTARHLLHAAVGQFDVDHFGRGGCGGLVLYLGVVSHSEFPAICSNS